MRRNIGLRHQLTLVGRRWLLSICLAVLFIFTHGFNADAARQIRRDSTASPVATNTFQVASHKKRRKRKAVYKRKKKRKYRSKSKKKKKIVIASPLGPAKKIKGPVQLVISLPDQRMTVYKGGKAIMTSRVSSGKTGYRSPTGVFSILQKKRRHYSNIYNNAPMPFMQRLTWSGIALHGSGSVPSYPASHGCIRLPHRFAKQLFSFTNRGAHVVISSHGTTPQSIRHAALFQPTPIDDVIGRRPTPAIDVAPSGETTSSNEAGNSESGNLETGSIEAGQEAKPASGQVNGETTNHLLQPTSAELDSKGEADPEPNQSTELSPSEMAAALAGIEYKFGRAQAYLNRSKSPLRILITRRTGREKSKDAQRLLNRLGYDAGDVDGYIGKQTIVAIKAFQTARQLPVTGELSDSDIALLYRISGLGKPSTGHLYVRQRHADLFDVPVAILDPDQPLGTHLYTAMYFDDDNPEAAWTALTLKERVFSTKARKKKSKTSRKKKKQRNKVVTGLSASISAIEALGRIEIPDDVRIRISDLLTPGSSLIVSDNGISRETSKSTDFIVLTR